MIQENTTVSFFFSFTQYNGLQEAHWVGWKNFQDVAVQDRELLLKAFSNAFYLAGIGVPLGLVTGLAIALLLNVSMRGIAVFRTLFYLPSIVPGVAGAKVSMVFDPPWDQSRMSEEARVALDMW